VISHGISHLSSWVYWYAPFLLFEVPSHHVLGQSGLDFCRAALQQAHQLTLYVRNPKKLPEDVKGNALVSVIKGTLEDESQLRRAITSGATVFVSFAGPTANSKGTVSLPISAV
jgi:putative NADH-flavin reductase